MDSLSGKSRALFVKDQQAWETYKTGQLEFINQYYLTRDGTMWWVLAADARAEVIRKRVLQLIHYYEMLPSDPD